MTELPVNLDLLQAAIDHCGSEKIHQLSRVQSYGALISVSKSATTRNILRSTDNIGEFFPTDVNSILGATLDQLVGEDQGHQIARLMTKESRESLLIYAVVDDQIKEMNATIHHLPTEVVIEFEPFVAAQSDTEALKTYERIHKGMEVLLTAPVDVDAYSYFINLARDVSGYERVMLYRFDESWDGEVIAESRAHGSGSYLAHRFPASDIPPQARELYLKNRIRFVMDAAAKTAEIVSLSPNLEPLDMTYCHLRGFSPVHIEYLTNMGVSASLSVSVEVDGKLWGLIACHASNPLFIQPYTRNLLELIGRMLSLGISSRQKTEKSGLFSDVEKLVTVAFSRVCWLDDLLESLKEHQQLIAKIGDASSVIVSLNGQTLVLGNPLSNQSVDYLIDQISHHAKNGKLITESLGEFTGLSDETRFNAGLIGYLSDDRKHIIGWIRPAKAQATKWAGAPRKAVFIDQHNQVTISPRKSFETWTDQWRHRATPWSASQIEVTGIFAKNLFREVKQLA